MTRPTLLNLRGRSVRTHIQTYSLQSNYLGYNVCIKLHARKTM